MVPRYILNMGAGVALLLAGGAAQSEIPANCTLTALTDPPRQMLSCGGSLVIELEPGTVLRYTDDGDGMPERMLLDQGSILIDVEPGTAAPQIRTPHAIAAVRGTVFTVEAGPTSTAIFVQSGTVDVQSRLGRRSTATLVPGQGVDVTPRQSITVRQWPQTRAAGVLARFGR